MNGLGPAAAEGGSPIRFRRVLCGAIGPVIALAIALALLRVAARGGQGITPDSVVYLEGARALARGAGYVLSTVAGAVPITHFPPLYPTVLAAASALSGDALAGALAVNVVATVALLAVVWLGMTRMARLGPVAVASVLLLLALNPELTAEHGMVWSEPLFHAAAVAGLFLLAAFLARPQRPLVAGAALVLTAAALTRYAGLSLLAAAPLLLLLARSRPWRAKLADAGVFCGAAALPLLLWLLRHHAAWSSATDRTLARHLPAVEDWNDGATAVSHWIFPARMPVVLGALIVLAVAVWTLALVLRRAGRGEGRTGPGASSVGAEPARAGAAAGGGAAPSVVCARVFLVAGFSYLAVVVLARALADALIPFDERMLSPAYVFLLIGVASAFAAPGILEPGVRRVAVVLAGLLVYTLWGPAHFAALTANNPWSYSSPGSRAMAADLSGLQRTVAYANDPEFLRFAFARPVRALPSRFDPHTGVANPGFEGEVRALCRELQATGGSALFVRSTARGRRWFPSMSELMVVGRLRPAAAGANWVVLRPRACD